MVNIFVQPIGVSIPTKTLSVYGVPREEWRTRRGNAPGGDMSEQFNGISKEDAAAWIKARRRELGYTQAQVQDAIGLPNVNYMTLYETARHDMRKSKYFAEWLAFCRVSVEDAREKLGVTTLITNANQDSSVFTMPQGAERPDGGVLVKHLGFVQAINENIRPMIKKGGIHPKHRLVECPLPIARKYSPDQLFVLTVDGDSMTCEHVKRTIPEGTSILFLQVPGPKEPRAKSIVVTWIPELGPFGVGVLKLFKPGKDGVVLESYNPKGARFAAKDYPGMIVQGIALGGWAEYE
jgi:transcriptional regulator with XRE-family HTH domain